MTRADYIYPYVQFNRSDAIKAICKWMAEGDYTPDDIFHKTDAIHKFDFLPVYHYTAKYEAYVEAIAVTAERVAVTKYMNGKPYRDHEWRAKQIPLTNNTRGEFGTKIYTGSIQNDSIRKFVEATTWEGQHLQVLENNGHGFHQHFQDDKQTLWNEIGAERLDKEAKDKAKRELFGLHKIILINLTYTDLKVECAGVLLPFFLFAYVYKGKDYHVIIDGNQPDRIDGVRPVNEARWALVWAIRTLVSVASFFAVKAFATSAYIDNHEKLFWYSIIVPSLIILSCLEIGIYRIKRKWKKQRQRVLEGVLNNSVGIQPSN